MKGTVYKSTGSWYTVKAETGHFYACRIKGKFRLEGIKSTNPIAVGDHISFDIDQQADGPQGVINAIDPRDNYIIRKSVNLSKQTHIIAANIDIAFLLVTPNNPVTTTAFIDRFLVSAEAYHIKSVLLFNKTDDYDPESLDEVKYLAALYRSIGYQCIGISAKTGKNIDQVKALMTGKVSMFSGHSGVGKSTLVNTLAPNLSLKTSKISLQHAQGQHTTTFAEMFDMPFGAQIIDTPGIKGFGLVAIDDQELSAYFPEFFALKDQCKFHNCLHVKEPHCAIKEALEDDKLAWSRYKSYLQILEGGDEGYRKDQHKAS
jgi:ribosome biogenesis GTPase / thiamine phosphate phosphatase